MKSIIVQNKPLKVCQELIGTRTLGLDSEINDNEDPLGFEVELHEESTGYDPPYGSSDDEDGGRPIKG